MKRTNFEFPVLVRHSKTGGYVIRPLFWNNPKKKHLRFQNALDSITNIIRNNIRGSDVYAENLSELLWYKFNPDPIHKKIFLSFTSGKELIHQHFTISSFNFHDGLVLHFPDFNDYMCMACNINVNHPKVENQILNTVVELVREEKKLKEDDFNIENYASAHSEFITTVNFHADVINEEIFVKANHDHMQSMIERTKFDGIRELYKVGYSLNELFPHTLKHAWYRDELTAKVHGIMFNSEAAVMAIIGPEGSGKTTIIHAALRKYLESHRNHTAPEIREVFHINPNRIIAGMSMVGQWQKRLEAIIEALLNNKHEYKKTAPDFLYFDNPVALFRIGKSSQNNMTLSVLLKPYLEKRKIPMIIEATPDEWKLIQEIDRRFADLCQVVRIDEANAEQALDIALKNRLKIEAELPVKLNNDALMKIFSIQRLHMHQQALPGSIVKYMEQLSVKFNDEVVENKIIKDFSERSTLRRDIFSLKTLKKDEVSRVLMQRLIGQEDAIKAMSDIIHLINANLNDPGKPMASLLYAGPTGVGKTQAAKVLANYMFESEENMVRFDMNEYIDDNAVNRLIGDFYNPEGQLTGRIRYNPYCVLLLDEIEKAHPDVHDLLLQVLGEGRLTDSSGHTVDFTNTIIIMTSNLGAEQLGHEMGYVNNENSVSSNFHKAIENFFRPEFINRIDEIVIFHRLSMEHIMQIAEILINELLNRDGFVRRTTLLKMQPEALALIAKMGYDPNMGARSLKRNIEKEVTEIAADILLDTGAGNPIIFELFLIQNKLVPRITEIKNALPLVSKLLPAYGETVKQKTALVKMLSRLNKLEEDVIQFREEEETFFQDEDSISSDDVDMMLLTDEIRSMKSKIENVLQDMEMARRHKTSFRTGFNKRGFGIKQSDWYCAQHKKLQDIYKQLEIKEYMYDLAAGAYSMINSEDKHMLEYFNRLSYINYFWKGYQTDKFDFVHIHVKPLINQISHHIDPYKFPYLHLWQSWPFLEIIFGPDGEYGENEKIKNGENHFFFSGPSLYDLLKNEDGIHLFVIDNQLYPASVQVELLNQDEYYDKDWPTHFETKKAEASQLNYSNMEDVPPLNSNIIRLYVQDRQYGNNDMITDIRTGIIHKTEYLTTQEAEMLLLFHMPDQFKPF